MKGRNETRMAHLRQKRSTLETLRQEYVDDGVHRFCVVECREGWIEDDADEGIEDDDLEVLLV